MDHELTSRSKFYSNMVEPTGNIEEKLASLTVSIANLATKDNISILVSCVEENFAKQIAEGDRKIYE